MENDIMFVSYLMAFSNKVKVMHWSASNYNVHKLLDDFYKEIESFKDTVAENILAINGLFDNDLFTNIKLPICSDVEHLFNMIEKCITKWFSLHKDDMKYEGCRNACSGFLEIIKTNIYLVRLM